ncbi:LOW QUALITY PROTEIN: general transcription factor 3C polypeptide 2-like [Salvia splendens]|uniref:LOW QUALITY PROTEIN: general transcription factor 3C polypeptide 2-like n=1 Tax=Salvia splendens TaxID=180675 RepID=UPI001C27FCA4|nr:LOW QUALITY PROTEIN: general transcription factor 3C polypeptide 2-like [Salvia splendens]
MWNPFWALDWCPGVDRNPENCIKSEFIAVAAHPPDSSYRKIGASLTGRGVIQIWCFLTIYGKDVPSQVKKKPRSVFKKKEPGKPNDLTLVQRPRGRPRKKPLGDTVEKIDSDNQHVQPLAIEYPMGSFGINSSGNTSKPEDCEGHLLLTGPKGRGNKRKAVQGNKIDSNSLHIIRHCQQGEPPLVDPLTLESFSLDSTRPDNNITSISSSVDSIPVYVALPRMVMCLAHNGKVVWDVKWRPASACFSESRNIMGYLAVLLGSGVLEVWEVPLPHAVKHVYPTSQKHIDPRFIKLQPVFRSSVLKCGDRQSIPLTIEWSVSSPHDMISAGCHEGMVAIWKLSVRDSLTECRPLVYINADTGPIRALAWAPIQSNHEGANIIITAGSKGFKFWDIRDPFCPLWVNPFSGHTYGLDWLPDPRCVYGAMEDGTMWLLSLERAAHDIPLTGNYHNVALKHGYHSFHCSAYAIWSLQASRLTGMVAYCGEEGSTICFQDPSRNRVPHYLCGSILEDGSAIVVATPLSDSSFQIKNPDMKRTQLKQHERRYKEQSIFQPTGGQESERLQGGEEREVVPPQIVAMHRVRWNINKGGEKWLCSGGAAGLVRCHHIHSFVFY